MPCFRIGRELRKSGHDVTLLGSDVQVFGRGHSEAWGNHLAGFDPAVRQAIHQDRNVSISEWLGRKVDELELDVVILDAVWQGLAYSCQNSTLKSVIVHHAGLPDFRAADMPTWFFVHPAHAKSRWDQARRAVEQLERSGRGVRGMFSSMKALSAAGRSVPDVYDFGCGELANVPAVRAMSLCPAVEFPNERGRMAYFGSLLPLPGDRDWRPLPVELVDDARPLIACVFGTSGLRTSAEYEWLFSLSKSLARAHADCQIIAVIPEWASTQAVAEIYSTNLKLYSWIPLWELLSTRKGAKVLVAPPGVGAFRDAIASGTPVVAIPRRLDQFGAAARVEYFGLGYALLSGELPHPNLVLTHVTRALTDGDVHSRVQRMRSEFVSYDATQPLKGIIEGLATSAGTLTQSAGNSDSAAAIRHSSNPKSGKTRG